ncbi:hypothetical protein BH09BAC5_BH09BAC5_16300 [soil metagenome]
MRKNYLLVGCALAAFSLAQAQTTVNFNYTGSVQTFVVPACVNSVTITTKGAQGANASDVNANTSGGLGGTSTGTLAVTPGQTLYIYVGQQGNTNGNGGYNGGGTAGISTAGSSCFGGPAGGGGGMSDVRTPNQTWNDIVIAGGGGGGSGRDYCNGTCQPCGCGGGLGGGGGSTGVTGQAAYNCGWGYAGSGINGAPGELNLLVVQVLPVIQVEIPELLGFKS